MNEVHAGRLCDVAVNSRPVDMHLNPLISTLEVNAGAHCYDGNARRSAIDASKLSRL
jgi:hypothetical protein